MSRPNKTLRILAIPVLTVLAVTMLVACGVGGEEKTLLNKYFMASKLNDSLTLGSVAMVSFDPKTDGQMQSFSIVSVGQETSEVLHLKKHAEDLKKAQDEEKAFSDKKKKFQDDNTEAIDRIVKAEGKNQTVKGKDAEIQKEWSKFREESSHHAKILSDLRKALGEDRPIVELSIQDARNPIDVTAYEGEIASKDVTIEGKVKPETGDAVTKQFVFTLKRATLKNVNGKDQVGRWIITHFKEAGK